MKTETKTPEQMAEEYRENHDECEFAYDAFLAGYQAAKEKYEAKIKEQADTLAGMEDECEGLKTIIYDKDKTNLLTPAKWISVKERLPKEAQEVLIYTERRDIYMARIYKDNEAYPFSNGCGCCGSEERYTHWMLPEAPEGEG